MDRTPIELISRHRDRPRKGLTGVAMGQDELGALQCSELMWVGAAGGCQLGGHSGLHWPLSWGLGAALLGDGRR